MDFLAFLVSFTASVAGAICGIGGGIIIKPVLDMLGIAGVSAATFLSGCTVLSMSCYSVGKALCSGEKHLDIRAGTPLALGACVGGVAGKQLFSLAESLFQNQNIVGAVQSGCLLLMTLATIVYTLNKKNIRGLQVKSVFWGVTIGFALGTLSSFLGIGGGPLNLVVLYFFFRMDTKTAAANSLYIILFSQAANLLSAVLTGAVPGFAPATLALMIAGGVAGGFAGGFFYRRMNSAAVEKLFVVLMHLIVLICIYNIWKYLRPGG